MSETNKLVDSINLVTSIKNLKTPYEFKDMQLQDATAFLTQFNDYVKALSFNEFECKIALRLALKGTAARWLESHQERLYVDIANMFLKRLVPPDKSLHAITMLKNLNQHPVNHYGVFLTKQV
ncbi:hypothetical protein HERIO_1751 [Hepatospora eriocheir]|uniref:Uncharacterized protein n=1 Tax=Hepatospora eriocheir TaxID=1081669 RepID=A0A1X0Q982_9MICR|nr:hypothetical protein HERIO_1751 [Hepatospora eriocheir]